MTPAIETLMNEHRVIEQVLGSLETFAENVARNADVDRATVKDYADFFRNFADKCHHAKEEDRLFVTMGEYGFPRDFGPVAVMLADHVEGRGHIGALAAIGEGQGPLSPEEREEVIAQATAYVPLLRSHIMKEDNILYPMAVQAVPAEVLHRMQEEFEAFEAQEMGAGTHERFHRLAEALIEAYPPDGSKAEEASSCFHCPGHM